MVIERTQLAFSTALGVVCLLILCTLLTAGLWPFCAPKNGVAWIAGGKGLQFGPHGTVGSAENFRVGSPGGDCTLEILVQPANIKGNGTILAFDSSPDPQLPFNVQQRWDDVAIERAGRDGGRQMRKFLETDRAFRAGQKTLVTITGAADLTVVYVNGSPAKVSSSFGLTSDDLAGRLVLGTSTVNASWTGEIDGLAVYDSILSPVVIQTHYQRWLRAETPVSPGDKQPVALYRFNEGARNTVHDQTGRTGDLQIPSRYFVLHPSFLESPAGAFLDRDSGWRRWSYWANVLLNVVGFVPMGFFFTAYFCLVGKIRRPRVSVVAMGLAVSLSIEIGQYFLPTRNSGANDLITNTLGTAIGVVLCSPALIRKISKNFSTTSDGPIPS